MPRGQGNVHHILRKDLFKIRKALTFLLKGKQLTHSLEDEGTKGQQFDSIERMCKKLKHSDFNPYQDFTKPYRGLHPNIVQMLVELDLDVPEDWVKNFPDFQKYHYLRGSACINLKRHKRIMNYVETWVQMGCPEVIPFREFIKHATAMSNRRGLDYNILATANQARDFLTVIFMLSQMVKCKHCGKTLDLVSGVDDGDEK